MKAADIREHFLSVAPWVDRRKTVDGIILGDPGAEIARILVTWIGGFPAVREAVARGCQMLVTHEPTFWTHENEIEAIAQWAPDSIMRQVAERKRRYIEEYDLVILRVHDVWDGMPEIGIPWAWARHLGLGNKPAAVTEQALQQRYDIDPLPLDRLARRVAERTASLGEPTIQVVGDGERIVSKVGIGTGCCCNLTLYQEMGCDVSVICDDAHWCWQSIQFAADNDHPIIRVNHGTSEEPGMVTLTDYINRTLSGVTAEHLPHGSAFRLVGGAPDAL